MDPGISLWNLEIERYTGAQASGYQRQKRWSNVREDETIAVEPFRVLRVESHELVEKNVGNWCHTHRGTGVTGVGLEGSIDLGRSVSLYQWQLTIQLKLCSSLLQDKVLK